MTSQGSNWKCNSIKNTIIWYSEKCKWALFALIIIFMLAGSYILSLYFSNKFKTKQQAYKSIDFSPVISKIFTYANLNFSQTDVSDKTSALGFRVI